MALDKKLIDSINRIEEDLFEAIENGDTKRANILRKTLKRLKDKKTLEKPKKLSSLK